MTDFLNDVSTESEGRVWDNNRTRQNEPVDTSCTSSIGENSADYVKRAIPSEPEDTSYTMAYATKPRFNDRSESRAKEVERRQISAACDAVYNTNDILNAHVLKDGSHENMSFALTIAADNWVVCASDSRRTIRNPNGDVSYLDDERKIFCVPNTNILAVLTGKCRFGAQEQLTFDYFLRHITHDDITGIANDIAETMTQTPMNGDPLVTLYAPTAKTLPRRVIITRQNGVIVKSEYGDISGRTYYQGTLWATTLAANFQVNITTADAAVNTAREIMRTIIRCDSHMANDNKTVGGRIVVWKADADGARCVDD